MAARQPSRPFNREEFEIAIVCAKDTEYNAVCLLVDDFWDEDGDPFGRAIGDNNIYTTGYMGGFNIVVVLLCNPGKAIAAGTAASLRSSYPCIKLLLLTGVCAGVPNAEGKEVLLGDVVISGTVIQYDLGSRYPNEYVEKDTLEDRLSRPDKNIRNLVAVMRTEVGIHRLEDKVSFYLRKIQDQASKKRYQRRHKDKATYQYPGSMNDMLFNSAYVHKHYISSQCIPCNGHTGTKGLPCDQSKEIPCLQTGCDNSHLVPRERLSYKKALEDNDDYIASQQPSIFIGRFGSGDTVFNSGIERDRIAQKHQILAFETEGAGIWDELLIVDALDECLADLPHLLNFIQSSSNLQVKWLISSRNETDIQDTLVRNNTKLTISLELSTTFISSAISFYIEFKVNSLSKINGYTPAIKSSIQEYLSHNADGTFLWVALVCELLEKAPSFDPLPKSAEYPRGLNNLYERMI